MYCKISILLILFVYLLCMLPLLLNGEQTSSPSHVFYNENQRLKDDSVLQSRRGPSQPFNARRIANSLFWLSDHQQSFEDVTISPVKNFTSILKGPWKQEEGQIHKVEKKEGILYFDVDMISPKQNDKNITYSFIKGDLNVRDGVYITDNIYYFVLLGAYNETQGFFVAVPPVVLESTINDLLTSSKPELHAKFPYATLDLIEYFQEALKENNKDIMETFERLIQYFSLSDYKSVYYGSFEGAKKERNGEPPFQETVLYADKGRKKFEKNKIYYTMKGKLFGEDQNPLISFDTETQDSSSFYTKSGLYTILASTAGFFGIIFLLYQIKLSNTQSMRSRISVMTIALLGILDSYTFLLHFTLAVYISGAYGYLSLVSFFNFVVFSIFEMRFMLQVWKSSQQLTIDQLRRQVSALYTKYYGALFLGIIIVYQFNFLFKFMLFGLYSFFIPQIILNFRKNAPKALHPLYVIGTAITRTIIPLYFYGCPNNFFQIEASYTFALLLTSWVFLQSSILIFQYYMGSRTFVPKALLPQKYNYRRPIPDSVIESGELKCVICFENVDKDDCLVTPCDHVYHEECLSRWMEEKLECPSCRQAIPFL